MHAVAVGEGSPCHNQARKLTPLVSLALGVVAPGLAFWLLCLAPFQLSAQPERETGAYLVVRSPLSSDAVTQLRNEIEHHISLGARKIILHFQPGPPSSLGVARDLANYLFREIQGRANIHAYADKPLSGHVILPFLAAEYRWFGPEGGLGKIVVGSEAPLSKADRVIYEEIARGRGLYEAVVLRLIYQPLSVYQVVENGQRHYKLEDTLLARQLEIPPRLLIGAGEGGQLVIAGGEGAGFISAEQAVKEFRLAAGKVNNLEELVDQLQLDRAILLGSVAVNPESKVAWIVVSNDLDAGTVSTLRRKWERALHKYNVGCVVFEIGASGNARAVQEVTAQLIQDIQRNQSKVLTVAYVPKRASGAATYLAFACREIVLCESAELGDLQPVQGTGRHALTELQLEQYVRSLRELTRFHGGEALADALFDPNVELVRVRAKKGAAIPGAIYVLRRDEAERRRGEFEVIDRPFRLTAINGQQARALGVSRFVLPNEASRQAVLQLFGLKQDNLIEMRGDWLDQLVNILAHPVTTVFLFILGFTCLLLEFKSGGLGLPAVIAAVCFLLIFWAHSWLAREVNSLAILLFLLGLALLLVELFVLPGMVVAGFSGVLLVICSVALLLVQHWPQSTEEYLNLAKYLGMLGGGLVTAIILAFLIGRHLPSVPLLRGLALPPPEPVSPTEATAVPVSEYRQYQGAVGVTTTALRPAGKALFGDVQLDVIADGGQYLEPGTRVVVIQVDGPRIVVQPLSDSG